MAVVELFFPVSTCTSTRISDENSSNRTLGSICSVCQYKVFCVTDRSKAILLWWFFLFYVLVFKVVCAVGALCMFSYFS